MMDIQKIDRCEKNLYNLVEEFLSSEFANFNERFHTYTNSPEGIIQFREMTDCSDYAPFHADLYNLALIHYLCKNENIDTLCELGTYCGGTSYYSANFLGLETYTCEPLAEHFIKSNNLLSRVDRIHNYNEKSVDFLVRNIGQDKMPLFYVDSHCYGFEFELIKELEIILSNYKRGVIIIDDFKIPGRDDITYCWNEEGQTCSMGYIEETLKKFNINTVYLSYQPIRTSTVHPLCGYCVISINNPLDLPDYLAMKTYTF